MVLDSFGDFRTNEDVLGIVAVGADGHVVARHGALTAADAFRGASREVHEDARAFRTWAPCTIEGTEVGRVAIAMSKVRLDEVSAFERRMVWITALACAIALLLSLFFVNAYLGPILTLTANAFRHLEKVAAQALEASRLKSEFLANMSHEIRTPMNGVLGMTHLLERTELTSQQRRYVETVHRSADALMVLINDILDFSKIEAGKLELRKGAFDPGLLVEDVAELVASRAAEGGLSLTCRVAADVPSRVQGDADRLRQVLVNLAGNAVKFTRQGFVELSVQVRADDGSPKLVVEVVDSGIGIRPDDVPRMFEVFTQADGSFTRTQGGTGLGLPISRRLVELMGGTLDCESTYGVGSTFRVVLPLEAAAIDTGARERETSFLGIRAAVLDDDPRTAAAIVAILEPHGVEAEVLTREACAESIPSGFDLAFVDTALRSANGGSLVHHLGGQRCPIVRVCRIDSLSDSDAMHTHVTKPVRRADVLRAVGEATGRRAPEATEAPRRDTEPPPSGPRRRLLVAEDNVINQQVLTEMLTAMGYDVEVVENGADAVEAIATRAFDAVLMDCQMPVMDGLEATRRIRAREASEGAPRRVVIGCTAHALVEERERGFAAGMDDYLTKPIAPQTLSATLHRLLVNLPVATTAMPELEPDTTPDEPLLDPEMPRSPAVVAISRRVLGTQFEALSAAAEAGDPGAIAAAAHKMKGGCMSIGAVRLASAARRIETAARAERVDEAREGVTRTGPIVAATLAALADETAS